MDVLYPPPLTAERRKRLFPDSCEYIMLSAEDQRECSENVRSMTAALRSLAELD